MTAIGTRAMLLKKLLALVGALFVGLLAFALPINVVGRLAPNFAWPGMLFLAFAIVGVCVTAAAYRGILSRLEC